MGMYTGLRFKGYVKPEFRKNFSDIAINGNWEKSTDEKFLAFANKTSASFIPRGALSCMPDEWQTNTDQYGDGDATDGFERTYDPETGYWTFQCSLKNYEDTIYEFMLLVPYFIESVEHAEVFYEEWDWSEKYELVNNKMEMTNNQFIRYNNYDD